MLCGAQFLKSGAPDGASAAAVAMAYVNAALRAEGQTILVIDKYVKRLVALADRHTIIERGQVVWQGDSAALQAQPELWQRYIGI